MALELPGYAIAAFNELHLPWPGIDEDQLREWATSVRAFATDLTETAGRVRQAVNHLAEESRSSFIDALAAYWDQQGRLIDGLTDPLDAFAHALDAAASGVEARKRAVISAAEALAAQLTAPQAPPANPPVSAGGGPGGRPRGPPPPQQVSEGWQAVSGALRSLEADLAGALLNVAVPEVTDYANGLAASLLAEAVPVSGTVETLRLSYRSLHGAAQAIRRQAEATERNGATAYSRNANRNLRDQSAGAGDPAGDGGGWRSVFQSVDQALGDVASVLFTITSQAVSRYQNVTANALGTFADQVQQADASERRHDPGRGAARESRLTFKIQENAGVKAAAKLVSEVKHGQLADAQFETQLFTLLKEHERDPGWQAGAMRTLGSTYLYYLLYAGHIPPAAKGEPANANIQALALAVAAATAHGVTFPARADGAATLNSEATQANAEELLAPLLRYANFPPQVLATLAYEASLQLGNDDPYAPAVWSALLASPRARRLYAGKYANLPPRELAALGKQALTYAYPPDPSAPPPTVIWAALAADPKAANLFLRENAGVIPGFASGSTQSGLPGDQASLFAGVIEAATTGSRETDPQHAAQAVSDLVMAYRNDPDQHAPAPIEAAYGSIIRVYWPDLQFQLTNMTGVGDKMPSPDGMVLTLADWSPFVDEALRDPATAWSVLRYGHTQAFNYQLKAMEYDGDGGDVYMWDKGFIDGYLDYQAKKVYSSLYQEDQAAAANWKSQLQTVADDVIQSGGNPVAFGTDVATQVVTNIVNSVIDNLPSDGTMPPRPLLSNFQGNYASAAATAFNESTPANLDGQRAALIASARGQPFVWFRGPSGTDPYIPAATDMSATELAAYNAWLSRPEVFESFYHPGPVGAEQLGYDAITTIEN